MKLMNRLGKSALLCAVCVLFSAVAHSGPPSSWLCQDGIDNDNDGLVDYPADPGCTRPHDCDERCNYYCAGGPWRCLDLVCDDRWDEDGDGFEAYEVGQGGDPGCSDAFAPVENPACDDGIDNDGDGFIDHPDDPGCDTAADSDETSMAHPCDNGIDDDGDGFIDWRPGVEPPGIVGRGVGPIGGFGDPGCMNLGDETERCTWEDPECWECDDGLNNEPMPEFYPFAYLSDNRIDYPDDPHCLDPWDSEKPNCWDQRDNDGDGLVDATNSGKTVGDPGCAAIEDWPTESPQCNDYVDNDGDGFVDMEDPDCASGAWWDDEGDPWRAPTALGGVGTGNTCGLGAELALVLPLLMALRRFRRSRFLLAIATTALLVGLVPGTSQARTLSNWGVLVAHGINDTLTTPAAFWDELAFNGTDWFGYKPSPWIRYPAYPIAASVRMLSHVGSGLFALWSTTVELVTYSHEDGVGQGAPLHPNPRHVWIARSAVLPKCDWPWANKPSVCLTR